MDLKDKVAVVTGGNSGIGFETAKLLREYGAEVIITGRRKEAIDKAASEISAIPIMADQGDLIAIEDLVRQVKDAYGQIDILFINAGILALSSIESTTEEVYDSIMSINLKGVYFTLSRFIPILKDGASVVLLSSNTASRPTPAAPVYAASKAALTSIMQSAVLELAPRKIRINTVSPGPTTTEVINKLGFDDQTIEMIKNSTNERVPLKKHGEATDVAKMVAYLCSDAANFMTGSEILMDGGLNLAS